MLRELPPGPHDRLLQPHPVPAHTASTRSCRGARRSSRACSAPTSSASSAWRTPATSRGPCAALLRAHDARTASSIDGAGTAAADSGPTQPAVVARRRSRSRSTSPVRGARAHAPTSRSAPRRSATTSATRSTIMLGVDRLDYTKGIGHRLKAFGELLAEGRLDVEDVDARAGREPEPRAGRGVPPAARRDRADGRPHQRRLRHHRPHARSATCTTATRARRWSRCTSRPTSCSSPRCATG